MGTKHTKPCAMFHERFPYCAHMYELPILRAFTITTMFLMIINILLTTTYFYLHWNFRQLIRNAFLLIMFSFQLLLMFAAIISSETHFEVMDLKSKMWTLEDTDSKSKKLILDDIKTLKRTRIIITITVLLASLLCVPITGDAREFFCILYVFEDIDKASWYPFFEWYLLIIKIFFGLTFSNPLFMMLTAIGDNTYGLIILREKVRSIEETFGIKEIWRFDEAYQKFVELTLKRCIQEHLRIKRYHEIFTTNLANYIPIVYIVSVLLFTSFYFNVRMNQSNEVLTKSLLIVLLCIVFSYLFVFHTQGIINEAENLHTDLCKCPWFLWNKSNQSMYFMLLIHTEKPLIIQCFGLQYDFGILIVVARTTMSVLTALQQLTN